VHPAPAHIERREAMAIIPIPTQQTTMTFNAVPVEGIKSISGIGSGSSTEIDTTTLASTAKEFFPGLRDFGSISVELIRNHDDLGQLEMFESMAAQEIVPIVITLPLSIANVATFQGFVTSLPVDIASDNVAMGTATIRITGAVAWS